MIENIKITTLENPKFVQPFKICYTQDGQEKTWEAVKIHDSTAILLVDETKKEFIFVKQLRPTVFLKNNNGFTYELCAGILDKNKSVEQTAKEEILEETGYEVELKNLQKITSFYSSVGFGASVQTLFFASVSDALKVGKGGGIDDEQIEVVKVAFDEIYEFMYNENLAKTPALGFAVYWYLQNHLR